MWKSVQLLLALCVAFGQKYANGMTSQVVTRALDVTPEGLAFDEEQKDNDDDDEDNADTGANGVEAVKNVDLQVEMDKVQGSVQAAQVCMEPQVPEVGNGYIDDYRGWYDVQGCGKCNDYCRWVGDSNSGGDPKYLAGSPRTNMNHGNSYWSCRLAGSTAPYTGKGHYTTWTLNKCSGKGGSPLAFPKSDCMSKQLCYNDFPQEMTEDKEWECNCLWGSKPNDPLCKPWHDCIESMKTAETDTLKIALMAIKELQQGTTLAQQSLLSTPGDPQWTAFADKQDSSLLSCSFDSDSCQWSTTGTYKWSRRSGRTPSSNTGPSADHSGSGSYMYVEASYPNFPSKQFVLESPVLALAPQCHLSFWYHMYGSSIGSLTLNAATSSGSSAVSLWTRSGNQGNTWQSATVMVPQDATKLQFDAVTGSSWSSDIAIDDIIFDCQVADGDSKGCRNPSTMDIMAVECECGAALRANCEASSDPKECWKGVLCSSSGVCGSWQQKHCPASLASSDHILGVNSHRANARVYINSSQPSQQGFSGLDEALTGKRSC